VVVRGMRISTPSLEGPRFVIVRPA